MKSRVVVLGAGFGGLEVSTILSEELGDGVDVTLIDKADAFVFGFSKLDVMFGHRPADAVRHPYRDVVKPGVRFVQTTVRAIDPKALAVETDAGRFEGDALVVALGADLDPGATPGLMDAGTEFYSNEGAFRMAAALERFEGGAAVVGVCGPTFKCPPAPSETALLLHDYLSERGRRGATEITLAMPFGTPIPPSPDTSEAILEAFEDRGIRFVKDCKVESIDAERGVARSTDGREMAADLLLAVPVHVVPQVVVDSGLASGPTDWVPVDKESLLTSFPGVWAVGDVNGIGTPKAGVFAEGTAKIAASGIMAWLRGGASDAVYDGRGACYIEFGQGSVARVDVQFLRGPKPTGTFQAPSAALVAEKKEFGASRRRRWFGHA